MKMRTLTCTKNKKSLEIADIINVEAQSTYKVDTIYQPAYACDKERLVVIVGQFKEKMPDIFERTLRSYNKKITSNVAFVVEGTKSKTDKAVDKYKAIIAEAGANVIDEVLYVKTSLFGGKATPEDITDAKNWIKNVFTKLV